ncbi:M12 family metallo-peptidase [Streptomyces sp. NPDC059002]|uniref:InlB B-repeat-containing protein n=1 Tax=Streptomyces sp. NPDC059002 TaxID=3346690 RepID=UPI003674B7EF
MRRLSAASSCALVTASLTALPLAAQPSAAAPPTTPAATVRPSFDGPDPSRPWVLRQAEVPLSRDNFGPLCKTEPAGPPPEYPLSLFPEDEPLQVIQDTREQSGPDTVHWTGHLADVPEHSVRITVTGACAGGPVTLIGTADLDRMRYTYTPAPDRPGHVLVEEVDTWALPARPPDTVGQSGQEPATSGGSARPLRAAAKPVVIDVVVGYTANAKNKVGGVAGMTARINEAESGMNRALAASGVMASVDVVHTYEATGYKGGAVSGEDGKAGDLASKLDTAKDKELGKKAAELRKKYSADLVALLVVVPDGESSGSGDWVDGPTKNTSSAAFSVTDVDSVVQWNNFAHELGHNLGLSHDRATLKDQKDKPGSTYPDGNGWITPDGKYHTIMAYSTHCKVECSPVNQYSNLRNTWHGQLLGDRNNNAARVLQQTAPVIAGYLTPKSPYDRKALTLTATPPQGGSVEPSIWGPYRGATQITVTAAAKKGYAFTGWRLDGTGHPNKQPTMALTMDKPHTLEAAFKKTSTPGATHNVTTSVAPSGGGRIELSPPGGVYTAGTPVTARATPAKGHAFARWTLDGKLAGTSDRITVTVSQDHALRATFKSVKPTTSCAHRAVGAISAAWQATGGAEGRLKCPTGPEKKTPNGKGVHQVFEGGVVYWTKKHGAHPVWGAFLTQWKNLKYEAGRLGFPTSGELPRPGGKKGALQTFQGGTLTWDTKTKKITATYTK